MSESVRLDSALGGSCWLVSTVALRGCAGCKDIIDAHISDPSGEDNCSVAERSIGITGIAKRRLALLGVVKLLMGLLLGLPIWPEVGASP
jgi:hypothetical protein